MYMRYNSHKNNKTRESKILKLSKDLSKNWTVSLFSFRLKEVAGYSNLLKAGIFATDMFVCCKPETKRHYLPLSVSTYEKLTGDVSINVIRTSSGGHKGNIIVYLTLSLELLPINVKSPHRKAWQPARLSLKGWYKSHALRDRSGLGRKMEPYETIPWVVINVDPSLLYMACLAMKSVVWTNLTHFQCLGLALGGCSQAFWFPL